MTTHDHTGDHTTTTTHDHTHEAWARGVRDGQAQAETYFAELAEQAKAQAWIDAYEAGTLDEVMIIPEPLSGEWAGESLLELGMSDWDESALDEYEHAYMSEFIATLCGYVLWIVEGHHEELR